MTSKSTRKRRSRKTKSWAVAGFKIARPHSNFPLTPHASGKWQKKINGQTRYFGAWATRVDGKLTRIEGDGWQEAETLYKATLDCGTRSRGDDNQRSLGELCDKFLNSNRLKVEAGDRSPRTYYEYKEATDLIIGQFGRGRAIEDLEPLDFETLLGVLRKKKWGPVRLGKFIQLIRTVFNYAAKNRLVSQPVAFGSEFEKPDKSVVRKHKAAGGKKLFTAQEIRDLLDGKAVRDANDKKVVVSGASTQMRAVILLGINAGLGNTDIGNLQRANLDLQSGWLDYPRIKTGLPRRAPLWKETIDALKLALAERPVAKDKADAGCVFLNRGRRRLVQSTDTSHSDYVSTAFGKMLREMKINGRKGLNFYSLRHTFATVGLQTGDRDAVKTLMGHASHDMLALYDETGPSDERLKKVASHVHDWLFGEGAAK